ncbi:HNH endonuclease signature motif containing protein [Niveibacterium sp. SC-1]|uniref:HNH endonuclease signature motif containing protein n=1 Tax=Niveibacterium sp. SC-1 TaxID=3135646 RepID=UPI00312000EF
MKRRPWSATDVEVLRMAYAEAPTAAIAKTLDRTERQVYSKALSMGLKKSAGFRRDPTRSGCTDGTRGVQTRFQAGHSSWNKGTHFVVGGRSAETRFKPGSKPHTWRPIGHVRTTKEGYLERKITDTGVTRRDYRPIHHLMWLEAGREIPPAHALVFINGDKSDLRLENFELVPRAELMRRNSIHRLQPELREVIHLRGAIRATITKRRKKELAREQAE